jgi:glucose-1-phosphate thymidylyltransferase
MVKGWWKDTGKLADMLEANRMVLDSLEMSVDGYVDSASQVEFKVVIEKGAEVVNSVIRGPAIIGEGARIVNSFIGPFTSIDKNVRIYGSEVEHSIILEGSSVTEVDRRIEDSLIGRNVEVGKSPLKPTAYRFMLGDNSKVGLL